MNTGSHLSLSWHLRCTVSVDRSSSKGSSSSRSWSRVCLGSLSILRQPDLWRLSLRAGLLVAGTTYAVFWMYAQMLAATGLPTASSKSVDIEVLRQAAHIFPLDRFLREQPPRAALVFLDFIEPEAVLEIIDETLVNDPWAWDLNHDRWIVSGRIKAVTPWDIPSRPPISLPAPFLF